MKARLRINPEYPGQTVLEFDLRDGQPVAASFEWEEDGDEFRFNGSIYDVIEKKISGSKLHIRCIDDEDEAAAIKVIEELQKKEGRRGEPYSVPLYQLLSLLLFDQHNCSDPVAVICPLLHIDNYHSSTLPVIIDILSPPPRISSVTYC